MSDIISLTVIIISLAAVSALVIFYLKRELSGLKAGQGSENVFNLIKQDIEAVRREVKESGQHNLRSLQSQLTESRKTAEVSGQIVRDITEKLTALDKTNQQVIGFAQQLQSLENILKNPKQRGLLGEYNLEVLLKNAFTPRQYKMQYQFKDGQVVDAVIFIGEKILPIDSKFSLETYNKIVAEKSQSKKEELEKVFKQDLKNRIQETAKYIRPAEGTFDFALMFIPAEGIYYDLMVNEVGAVKANTRDLLEYAVREKNVHIVSPNSFYAFLQTILQGLRGFQIEKTAQEIKERVGVLGRHLAAYDNYMKKLGSHLGTVCNTYNTAYKELAKIDKDVVKITEGERKIDPLQIEKPSVD